MVANDVVLIKKALEEPHVVPHSREFQKGLK